MTTHPRWTTRAETAADIPAVHGVELAAFPSADEAELVSALRRDPAWIEGLSVVTTAPDGTVVGHALLTRCHIDDVPALCLAPCAVLPAHQRTGAGSAAIRAVLQAARKRGEAFVVVLGHPEYYPRFGFERASAHGPGPRHVPRPLAGAAGAADPEDHLPRGPGRAEPCSSSSGRAPGSPSAPREPARPSTKM